MDRRREGRARRARSLPGLSGPLQVLEGRQLMAYSPLGYSLPDLVVDGFSAPLASYGGPLTVTVDVRNIGASSIVEPLSLRPGTPSTADAGPSTVGVFASSGRRGGRGVLIGEVVVPPVGQNDRVQVSQTFILPDRPRGFRGDDLRLTFRADNGNAVGEIDETNNSSRSINRVAIATNLPDVRLVDLDLPATIRPGDTISPSIRIANYGAAATGSQGPFQVRLVASLDRDFGAGDTTIDQFTVENLAPLAIAPSKEFVPGDANIDTPANFTTLGGRPVTVPATPSRYFIGVVIDPTNAIRETSDSGRGARGNRLGGIRRVGGRSTGLPTSGLVNPSPITPSFPDPGFPVGTVAVPSEAGQASAVENVAATPGLGGTGVSFSQAGATSSVIAGQVAMNALTTNPRGSSARVAAALAVDRGAAEQRFSAATPPASGTRTGTSPAAGGSSLRLRPASAVRANTRIS